MKTPTPTPVSSPVRVPDRWSWHYQRLQSFRDHLLENRDVQMAEAAEPLEPHSMDLADSATDEFDHDLALGILSQEQDALYEVNAAIRRILDGKYGNCEETGKPIPAARLRAVPWTRYLREVEERLEQEGLVNQTHLGAVSSIQTSGPRALSAMEDPEDEDLLTREVAATESP
ncbi:TraR/DksA family transcriptional regulator [Prosthecobacter sp.]|uniref:TraR/DksA family transcriptional regulator n=1 Tax=Prosthecobacter sp. TaxID=1965333 RepID=UPI002ABC5B44|nr:TraR/DksA family transcriptional regulator [Prosthecobacter sp.]MDZ4403621.1 TraR/DksA family transcriptional regulator [Prosthecobacter sp.]